MFRSLRIGTAFGIGLYIHPTFILVPIIVAFMAWNHSWAMLAVLEAAVLTLFGCVLLHELGHALMARLFGIGTRDITLYPIGGVARLERMSENSFEEIMIAIAGPAVNVVIATGLFLVMAPQGILPTGSSLVQMESIPWYEAFLHLLFLNNIALVIFNMLPIFPMDGGRVFRAMLAVPFGQLQATLIAFIFGTGLAMMLSLVMLVLCGAVLAPVVMLFAILAGLQELAMVRAREAQRQALARRGHGAYDGLPLYLGDPRPPEPNFSGFTFDRFHGGWIEWRNGQPVHLQM